MKVEYYTVQIFGGVFTGLGAYRLAVHPNDYVYGLVCLALGLALILFGWRMRAKERPNA